MKLFVNRPTALSACLLSTFITVLAIGVLAFGGQAQAAEDDTIVVARSMDINSLDPHRAWCDTCKIYVGSVYETLVGMAKDNKTIIPRLAKSWTSNGDATQYTFKLDEKAVFSDGSPVEAKDVKWSIERLQNLKEGPSMFVEGIQKIEAPDAKTVVITVSGWGSELLGQLAVPYVAIVNSDVAKAQGATAVAGAAKKDTAEGWFQKNSSGSGPFVLAAYRPDEELRLARNEKYYGEKAGAAQVVIKEVKDAVNQAQMLESGSADISTQIDADTAKSIKDGNVVVKSLPSFNFIYFAMVPGAKNSPVPMTRQVREALGYALDYKGILDITVGGAGRMQAAPIATGFPGTDNLPMPKQGVAKAKELLAAAGVKKGTNFVAAYPNMNQYGVDLGILMQKIQQDFSKVGIELTLQPITFAVWLDRIKQGNIPMTVLWFAPDYFGTAQYVTYFSMAKGVRWFDRARGYTDVPGLENKTNEELLAKAAKASAEDAAKIYHEIGLEMIKDRVIIPVVNPNMLFVYRKNLKGVRFDIGAELPLAELTKK